MAGLVPSTPKFDVPTLVLMISAFTLAKRVSDKVQPANQNSGVWSAR